MHPTPRGEHIFLFTQHICICTTILGANDCDLGEYQQKIFLLTLPLCLSAYRGKKKCIPGTHKHANILGLTEAIAFLNSPRKNCIVALCEITRAENWLTFCSRTPERCFQKKKFVVSRWAGPINIGNFFSARVGTSPRGYSLSVA